MAIFTEYYCRSLLEDSVILPQEIKDAIKKIKELDKKYKDKYKSDCFGKIQYQDNEDIDTDIETSHNIWLASCLIHERKQGQPENIFASELADRQKIFLEMLKELKSYSKNFNMDESKNEVMIFYYYKK